MSVPLHTFRDTLFKKIWNCNQNFIDKMLLEIFYQRDIYIYITVFPKIYCKSKSRLYIFFITELWVSLFLFLCQTMTMITGNLTMNTGGPTPPPPQAQTPRMTSGSQRTRTQLLLWQTSTTTTGNQRSRSRPPPRPSMRTRGRKMRKNRTLLWLTATGRRRSRPPGLLTRGRLDRMTSITGTPHVCLSLFSFSVMEEVWRQQCVKRKSDYWWSPERQAIMFMSVSVCSEMLAKYLMNNRMKLKGPVTCLSIEYKKLYKTTLFLNNLA